MLLQRLLSRRFGPLSQETLTRPRRASPEQLETWTDLLLDAWRLEDVFQG